MTAQLHQPSMKTSTKILCALLVFTAAQLPAQSVPEYVNYQGQLRAADGSPLATGNYTIEFNIYDQANEGAKVWGPFLFDGNAGNGHGPFVPVLNGSFNVIIGPRDTTGASIATAFSGPSRYIEIKVNGGAPILPRQQFLSTAYAFAVGNASFELSAEALKARGTNAIVLGAGLAPATGAIHYQTNTPPSLLIRGAGSDDSSRRITLSGAVSVTNAAGGAPALAVAGNASLTGNLTCAGNATVNGTLQAASLTDGTRTIAIPNIIRSDPPLVISAIYPDTRDWVITNVDLSLLGNDEDGCRIRVYMQHEIEYTMRPVLMDFWFEQPGFTTNSAFPGTVKMIAQLLAETGYYYREYALGDSKQSLFDVIGGPWLQLNNYPRYSLNGGTDGLVSANRFNLWFHFHPHVSAKIMVFDN